MAKAKGTRTTSKKSRRLGTKPRKRASGGKGERRRKPLPPQVQSELICSTLRLDAQHLAMCQAAVAELSSLSKQSAPVPKGGGSSSEIERILDGLGQLGRGQGAVRAAFRDDPMRCRRFKLMQACTRSRFCAVCEQAALQQRRADARIQARAAAMEKAALDQSAASNGTSL